MKKTIILEDEVLSENNQVVAKMSTTLKGDGSTPDIMTIGGFPIGFNDDGTPIIAEVSDKKLEQAHADMMAVAIKEQKALCEENGVDPELVNILDAEKEVKSDEQQ